MIEEYYHAGAKLPCAVLGADGEDEQAHDGQALGQHHLQVHQDLAAVRPHQDTCKLLLPLCTKQHDLDLHLHTLYTCDHAMRLVQRMLRLQTHTSVCVPLEKGGSRLSHFAVHGCVVTSTPLAAKSCLSQQLTPPPCICLEPRCMLKASLGQLMRVPAACDLSSQVHVCCRLVSSHA